MSLFVRMPVRRWLASCSVPISIVTAKNRPPIVSVGDQWNPEFSFDLTWLSNASDNEVEKIANEVLKVRNSIASEEIQLLGDIEIVTE